MTIFSIHFSATKIPTPPKLKLSPDHEKLCLQHLPVIIRVEQPLQHVSWTAKRSVLLLARVLTTSLAAPRISYKLIVNLLINLLYYKH